MRLLLILTILSILALGIPVSGGLVAMPQAALPVAPSLTTGAPHFVSAPVRVAATTAPHAPAKSGPAIVDNYQHQCREVNQSICVMIDNQSASTDVVPHFPNATAPWNESPLASDDIYFDVLSVYNISNQSIWNGPTSLGPNGEFIGTDAFIYLSVTDVLWNGVAWFCTCDDTVWHADAGQDWAPTTGTFINQTYYKWEYTLSISAASGTANANNFPNGTYVQWNVTVTHFAGGKAIHNSTQQWSVAPFSYFVRNAWYWSTAYQSAYPNNREETQAFAEDINMSFTPAVPQVGDQVIIYLNTTSWDHTSGAMMAQATVVLKVWYPNGTFWRSWAGPFVPTNPHFYPTNNATITLPSPFFANAGETVEWYIASYDQYGDYIQSANVTQTVSHDGLFNGTFYQNLEVTSTPSYIAADEDQNGTIFGTVPGVQVDSTVNITVTSLNQTVGIQAIWLYIHVYYPYAGINTSSVESMKRITLIHYYYTIPELPPEANITFVLKAWDFNETSLLSHPYRYFIPLTITPPASLGFFYIEVYDQANNLYPSDCNVTIIGLAGSVDIPTVTQYGIAFPNVTNKPDEPEFLPANNTYRITIAYPAFLNSQTNPPGDMLTVSFELLHTMNVTQLLSQGPNYQVVERGDIIYFSLNTPGPPPVYATSVNQEYLGLALWGGLAVAVAMLYPVYSMWKEMRARAEAEEKRITL